ncbi:LysR family transcriptional regulator [Herbiconiux sp. KACC 21604]|uniref:LysR family transcriptional regulator n=1 Tax=unclassified Herbiconiux TaxID=2618217 RepID=UPI0014908C55|nr:LysR family transcriptional regulator [Herbiconiux sp. SALV-R1]QJU55817.1 LysR family transcriptional regulator [Herbiconiux sp. SALV-R1]WPO87031.1 LysR family transcriptional regulator [Herbiconiux sp. KACC 21604]
MLSVPRLRLLSELHRVGSLAEVARVLNYTPSAVSQQLSLLERETGVPLLEREGRGVRLTGAALALVEHARVVLSVLERAEAELSSGSLPLRGTLRVAAFQTAMIDLVPRALEQLATEHPLLEVRIVQREARTAYEGLLGHEFDVLLGEGYSLLPEPVIAGVERLDFHHDRLLLAVPRTGALAALPHTVEAHSSSPWAMDSAETQTGRWAQARCRHAGFEPHVRYESSNPLLHAQLVRRGAAVAFIPDLVGAEILQGVDVVDLGSDDVRTIFTAVRTERSATDAVRALRAALAGAAAETTTGATAS